ncbi:uncharacterized protein LOC108863785 [Galendromus occidentalis]|uniref:Uncharacterized protein LOC108863785 n=1 Tax=Galendromus occidentalis TaxID=34638 RepID=A0AAJ7L2N1_9ACAR|nr:uncharacterized protein LOC108863785 [Galendromus occidentalis]
MYSVLARFRLFISEAGFLQFTPFIALNRVGDEVSVAGPMTLFFDAFEARIGSISFLLAGDMAHGVRLENGSFTGVMGLIQKGLVDVFLAPSVMVEERIDLAEAVFLGATTYRFLTWQPSKVEATIDSSPLRRRSPWLRLCLSAFMFVFPLVLMNLLNSKLISIMTVRTDEDFINKYEDVLRFPNVRIYSEAGSTLSLMFQDPKTETFRKLSSRLIQRRGLFSHGPKLMAMMSEVAAKQRVITCTPEICQGLIMKAWKERGKCLEVMTSPESSGPLLGTFFVSYMLSRSLRGDIRSASLAVLGAGLYQEQLKFIMFAAEKCAREETVAMEPLAVRDVKGSFLLLAVEFRLYRDGHSKGHLCDGIAITFLCGGEHSVFLLSQDIMLTVQGSIDWLNEEKANRVRSKL